MKKQTAVQWLLDTMANSAGMEQPDTDRVFKQALEMEKQQIENAYKQGHEDGYYFEGSSFDYEGEGLENHLAETYYKETYGD